LRLSQLNLRQSLSSINDFAATATLIGTNHGGLSTPETTKSPAIFIARDFVFSSWDGFWDDPFVGCTKNSNSPGNADPLIAMAARVPLNTSPFSSFHLDPFLRRPGFANLCDEPEGSSMQHDSPAGRAYPIKSGM